jgi:RimJ/RimL family protein N-acetyltransferase
LGDADFLLALRNDSTTRRFSLTQHLISTSEHVAWLTNCLSDPAALLWIALSDEAPAGQLRLTRLDALTAEVHIAVAPALRGRGLARLMLTFAAQACEESWPEIAHMRARIMAENGASLRTFRAAGFEDIHRPDDHGARVFERAIRPD